MAHTMVRQGDVLLIRVDQVPSFADRFVGREEGRVVLAHGELTGHAHAIAAREVFLRGTVFGGPEESTRWLTVATDTAVLRHEEHGAIDIPRGTWRVVRQREYDPRTLASQRWVAD